MFIQLRRIYQVTFFVLFLFLVFVTAANLIGGYPVEWFLGFDPLVAISIALASHTITWSLVWAIPLIVLTLIFGRFFCGWMCPMGFLHHLFSRSKRDLKPKIRAQLNLPRTLYKLKYFILIVMLVLAFLGTNQIGLLDPIAFTWRAFATAIVPTIGNSGLEIYQGDRHFHYSTVIVFLFFAALSLNLIIPRLYCRMLCPLGALLGFFAKFSLFRIKKNAELCKDCNVCGADCQGAANPQGILQVTECMVCLNCQTGCPRNGISYGFLDSPELATKRIDLGRRKTITSVIGGIAAFGLIRSSDGVVPRPHPNRIRPPGALEEEDFLGRCIKCGACMKVCPTSGLQPAWNQAGLEGLWSPILIPQIGYCEHSCVLCGQVCPTGAIKNITILEKVGKPPEIEPIRIGSAFIDRGRCLPWAMETPCIVCEEVCPTSPKAIHFKTDTIIARNGKSVLLKRPFVDLEQCVGCGICENHCPVFDKGAIRVTCVGETRSEKNRIMLKGGRV